METKNYLQIMADSLKMKKDILTQLVELNEAQKEIFSNQHFTEEAFRSNIDVKDELVTKLIKMDEGFNSLFNRVKEELESNRALYSGEIAQLQSLIREITELSARVETQEARNKLIVQDYFMNMKRDVRNAKQNAKMANTYYKNMNKINYEPHFMDKKK